MLLWFRRLPDILYDLTPDFRSPVTAAIATIVALITAVTWFGWDASSPIRAAEAAARGRLGDPNLDLQRSVIRDHLPRRYDGFRHRLVCGAVANGPAFAAVVRENRRSASLLLFSGLDRDRVEALALGSQGDPDLLAACAPD